MAHNRARMPQDEGQKRPKLVTLGAKVTPEMLALVDHAAVIRGWPRSRVVELGAIAKAQEILDEYARRAAQVRKAMRQAKSQAAGRARKRPSTTLRRKPT